MQTFIAKRLTTNGEEFLYEEIPVIRMKLKNEFEYLINHAAQVGNLSSLSSGLLENLHAHFAISKNFLTHLFEEARSSMILKRELNSIISSNLDLKHLATDLLKLAEQKGRLDFSYSHQFILKYWSYLHIPFIAAMFIFTALHVYLVYFFRT